MATSTNIDPALSIQDVIDRDKRAAEALVRLGLDACCGAHRPLLDACRENDVTIDQVEAALHRAGVASDVLRPCEARPVPAATPESLVRDEMTVREILARWPATRDAFEQAGLMGCGGAQGPDEPLGFFADMHHVPLEALKRSLDDAIRNGPSAPVTVSGRRPAGRPLPVAPVAALSAEPAHRYVPFLVAAIVLTLTLGATLGMINLARLTTPFFGALSLSSVRAHAFVQVFGFVGLFVIGIACHVLPRFAGRPLAGARLVPAILGLQIAGVLGIAAAFLFRDEAILWAWTAGSLALVAASALFLFVVARTVATVDAPERFGRWVIAGAAWQVTAAGGSVGAAWQGDVTILQALWPAALWGFAGSWIFGVGRRIFPGFLGWRPREPHLETGAFVLYQFGVLATAVAAWPMLVEPPAVLVAAGALALAIAVPLYSWCLGVGSQARTRHDIEGGYQRFVFAGWAWLAAALAVGPIWTLVSLLNGRAVAPLVTDFARHAFAFGFVTQVMMGVASRVLPVFTGHALWSPGARTAAFHLLNASVVLRALEAVVALGYLPAAWPFIAIAGPLAVAAVVLFGLNVVFTIYGRAPAQAAVLPAPATLSEQRVSDILEIPGALEVLVEAGFTPLRNPVMRATFAGSVTLRQACSFKGVALEPLVARLEQLQAPRPVIRLRPVR